jgi:hypothetical protein
MRKIIRQIVVLAATVTLGSSVWASPDGFGGKNQQDDPYKQLLLAQIQLIAPTAEQNESFRELMREYFKMRNGATRRISRQGGDIDKKVTRDLRRCAREAVEAMSKVLTARQLIHYEKLVEIGNEQYMANAGLL